MAFFPRMIATDVPLPPPFPRSPLWFRMARGLGRRRHIVLSTTLLGALSGAAYAEYGPKVYSARTSVKKDAPPVWTCDCNSNSFSKQSEPAGLAK